MFVFVCAHLEAFIHNLLKDLRMYQVDMDSLSPVDLDKMAHVITGTVQGVGADKEQEGARRGAGATWRGQADSSEAALYGDVPGEPSSHGSLSFVVGMEQGHRAQMGCPSHFVVFLPGRGGLVLMIIICLNFCL